ncbi:hypothetical protein Pmani_002382 [Petrolisthes manimaculis]|uniref:Amino acid transporter transmembrane domain-containing protein n=1 Tax=Petrolisthes manimaculis TaxID=1843537 RepID=A0AAE1UJF7_9EUCA|nr:hypothetical protein Pmani_002382 [Petrolisthes manimaculis]
MSESTKYDDETDTIQAQVIIARHIHQHQQQQHPQQQQQHDDDNTTPEDSLSPQSSSSHYTLVDDDVALLPPPHSGRTSLRHHQDLFASCQLTSSSGGYYAGISWYKAVFLIVNAALGAGLLNFPEAFHEAGGILAGNLVHIIFTTMALGSLIIIAKCSSELDCSTYQELLLRACGQKWSVVCSVCISVYCFITCVTFIIIIGDQFDRVFASYIGSTFCHHWYLNRQFTMSISSLLLIFPSCYKRIDGLRFMSYVGVLSIWYLTAVIVTEYYRGNYERGPVVVVDAHWEQVFNVVPTICFGYQCHVSSVPIYSCLQQREAAVSIKACIVAIITCLIVYTLSANYGYLTFGSMVGGDVLMSYDATQPHVLIAILLLAIKSWTTYPLLLFCVREAIGDLYIQMKSLTPDQASHSEPTRRKVIAVLLWILSILMAIFTPNINIVVKLLGSLAAFFIFVFPGLCLMEMRSPFLTSDPAVHIGTYNALQPHYRSRHITFSPYLPLLPDLTYSGHFRFAADKCIIRMARSGWVSRFGSLPYLATSWALPVSHLGSPSCTHT